MLVLKLPVEISGVPGFREKVAPEKASDLVRFLTVVSMPKKTENSITVITIVAIVSIAAVLISLIVIIRKARTVSTATSTAGNIGP